MKEKTGGAPEVEPATEGWRAFLSLDDAALLAQCAFDRFQTSGPGGQKRNRTASAVRLRHHPSGLAANASESRSQHENRARALQRLRRALAFGLREHSAPGDYRPPPELQAALTADGRFALGRRDARFVPAVAALFDLLEERKWRVSDAARALGVPTAQLTRFLTQDSHVLRAANERRRALQISPLRSR